MTTAQQAVALQREAACRRHRMYLPAGRPHADDRPSARRWSARRRWVRTSAAHRSSTGSWAAVGGTIAVVAGAVMVGLLHTTAPGARVNPVSKPLSVYALTTAAWLFNSGVAALALGLGLILVALVRSGGVQRLSAESITLTLCAAGLLTLIVFPDIGADGRLTTVGWIHWGASMAAFGALPVTPLLLGQRHPRSAGCSALLGVARLLALGAAGLLAIFVTGSALELLTSIPMWRIGGAVERALAAAELAALLLIGIWVWRGCPGRPQPRSDRGRRALRRRAYSRRYGHRPAPGSAGAVHGASVDRRHRPDHRPRPMEEARWRTACITPRPPRSLAAARNWLPMCTRRSRRSAGRCSPTAPWTSGPNN
jgi:hypothetical protein